VTVTVPLVNRSAGDLLTTTLWNTYVVANLNKLLYTGHRKLTVAQFAALTGIEDGDEVYLEVDATNGIEWHLVYRTAEATYKWRFLGGPEMAAQVATDEAVAAGTLTYSALATAGPSVALPRAGDYDVIHGCRAYPGAVAQALFMSYDIGATGAVDADAAYETPAVASGTNLKRRQRKTALTAVSLVSKYKHDNNGAAGNFCNRSLFVMPVRLRHDA
jgi:hypothetical protein